MLKAMSLCTLFFLALAPVLAAPTSGARAAIERLNAKASALYAAGDSDGIATLFAADGRQLPPNSAPLIGREAIRNYWKTALKAGKWEFTLQTQHVDVSGRLAVELGKYRLRFTAGANAPMPSFEDHGNYLVEWRQEADGEWRAVFDAPVSEVALPAAPPASSKR